jgi:hypothetical protein
MQRITPRHSSASSRNRINVGTKTPSFYSSGRYTYPRRPVTMKGNVDMREVRSIPLHPFSPTQNTSYRSHAHLLTPLIPFLPSQRTGD